MVDYYSQRESIHVAHLEGLASTGMIKQFKVEDCEHPGMGRIVAELVDGRTYVTKCIDSRGLKKVVMYLQYASNLSRLIVEGIAEEEREEQG
ncbi:hypothetical protein [Hyperthermus butylicus]|uniref:Uncharacterized protein n=1 Tax=Hyperthermus butylicus (strain DSM 5456 / JCM 9403 / PLM1-5) TaxID=415426 RepID=A2BM90_HYPBU|nr:hypothetical protein [Hyperthermus butylicus]ABM81101.1 hypothetical protein Hbut_1269 [Hyperthermus butylicus DSM 5456]